MREALTSASCVRTSACSRACPKVPCVRPSESFGGWYGAYGSAVSRALWALCGLEHAKYVPKPSAGVVHRLYLRRSADHRVRPARSFTRRLLCLLSYTGGKP